MAAIFVRTIGVAGRAESTWRAGERRCIYVPFIDGKVGEVIDGLLRLPMVFDPIRSTTSIYLQQRCPKRCESANNGGIARGHRQVAGLFSA
jgi:hypothetical protein